MEKVCSECGCETSEDNPVGMMEFPTYEPSSGVWPISGVSKVPVCHVCVVGCTVSEYAQQLKELHEDMDFGTPTDT